MLVSLRSPAEQDRGPDYMEQVLTAMHQANRRRRSLELLVARRGDQVGVYCRFPAELRPVLVGQLCAMYPKVRVESLDESALDPPSDRDVWQATLQLRPQRYPLRTYEQFYDNVNRTLIDPLATLLNALAAGRSGDFTPSVMFVARPVGRVAAWFARRSATAAESGFHEPADRQAFAAKFAGHLYYVELRLQVAAPVHSRAAALAKLHELAGVLGQFTLPKVATWQLSRVRRGRKPRRWFVPRSLVSCAELATLWHPATGGVQAPTMLVERSRELEPPLPSELPTRSKHADLAVLGRVRFRDRHEQFGILPDDRLRHLYLVGKTGVGKSTLLLNMIAADIAASRGVQLLDPHGDLAEAALLAFAAHEEALADYIAFCEQLAMYHHDQAAQGDRKEMFGRLEANARTYVKDAQDRLAAVGRFREDLSGLPALYDELVLFVATNPVPQDRAKKLEFLNARQSQLRAYDKQWSAAGKLSADLYALLGVEF